MISDILAILAEPPQAIIEILQRMFRAKYEPAVEAWPKIKWEKLPDIRGPHFRSTDWVCLNGSDGALRLTTYVTVAKRAKQHFELQSACACQTNCCHAAAALLALLVNLKPSLREYLLQTAPMAGEFSQGASKLLRILWDQHGRRGPRAAVPLRPTNRAIVYGFEGEGRVIRHLVKTSHKLLLKGGVAKRGADISWMRGNQPDPAEDDVDARIKRIAAYQLNELPESAKLPLAFIEPNDLFGEIMKAGRLYVRTADGYARIQQGEVREVRVVWKETAPDVWQMKAEGLPGTNSMLIAAAQVWYLDPDAHTIGPVNGDVRRVLDLLDVAPQVQYADFEKLQAALEQRGMVDMVPPLPVVGIQHLGVVKPVPEVYFASADGNYMQSASAYADIYFHYGTARLRHDDSRESLWEESADGKKSVRQRDNAFERDCLSMFEREFGYPVMTPMGFEIGAGPDVQRQALEFQIMAVPRLRDEMWCITYSREFRYRIEDTGDWTVDIRESGAGWYDVEMSTVTESGARLDLVALLRAALERQVNAGEVTYLYLAGSNCWIGLPQERVVQISRILLDLTNSESEDSAPRISRFDLGAITDLDNADNIRVVGGEDIKALARRLVAPPDPLPEAAIGALGKPLRPYQADGVQWLRTRKAVGVGAILSDEMGIGKTLQVLCALWVDICEGQTAPSIVVLPKTLVGKWQDEQREFLPDMNIVQITGVANIGRLASLKASDVVLTTYGALVEHSEKFTSRAWNIVPCDEAHLYLSNPKTATHRAVKRLKANQILPITGTPMQNKPDELWALMDLAVPGLLRSHRWFRQQFVTIEKGRNALPPEEVIYRRKLLGRMTSPFRLARKNKDVGNQLPKINVVHRYLDMEPAQKDVYETVRASMNREVRGLLAQSGLAKNQISILAAINRLRQVCCSPSLLKGSKAAVRAPSVKMEEILRIASELDAEDRQIVIVSEWAEMLGLVAKELDGIGIRHVTLTGKSGSITQRNSVISSFRTLQVRVLLMTLTVGGVGLDLPEASVMVFCEEWWNPAKMAQAAARMTRDDSKTHVTAIHLLVRGSLEEGVKAIAERKGEMVESILGDDSAATTGALTEADIEQLLQPLVQPT